MRDLEGLDDLDFRVEVLPASTVSSKIVGKPSEAFEPLRFSFASVGAVEAREADFEVSWRLRRLFGIVVDSLFSDDAFRFRNDRDPSSGSSSRIRVLNTEWEPGLDTPLWAGSRSLVNLDVDDLLRETVSS